MPMTDLNFIFRFLPVMLAVYYVTPHRFRTFMLLIGSVFFYAVSDFKFLPLILFAVIVNALLAEGCFRSDKTFLVVAVFFNVLLLALFKILGMRFGAALFPMGISFYTFKMISYQADLYKEQSVKRPNMVQTAAFFTMFPQVMQGPIMRYDEMLQCRAIARMERQEILERIEDGLKFFAAGFFLKVMVADRLSMCFGEIGRIGYESITTPLAWIGAATYSMNLYYDFWGYSLMAAGVGVMLGFPFIENFRHPYAATGVADFYRRWHTTLGRFFRDYVYIPLGGSRKGGAATIRNLLIVWLLTAFWHGASVNFFLWGMALFVLIVYEKTVLQHFPLRVRNLFGRVHVLVFIPLTWVIFAITDTGMLAAYFGRLFSVGTTPVIVNAQDYVSVLKDYWMYLALGIVFLIPGVYDTMVAKREKKSVTALLFVLFWVCVYHAARASGNPFMYVNF